MAAALAPSNSRFATARPVASLWQATGPAAPLCPRLAGDRVADVVVIGGGYAGLSTARYLARSGLEPVVLEAGRIGGGGSGRNGGVVSGKFRIAFRDIAAAYGIEAARRMHDLGNEAIAHVGELVRDYGIADAAYRPTGSLRCAHTELAFEALKTEAAWLQTSLGDDAISILSADQVRAEVGAAGFVGGMLNRHGGVIHPLAFVYGLAKGLLGEGVSIHPETPVLRFRREGAGVLVETPFGTIRAGQVVIATDAYSDLTQATEAVRTSIIPFRSAMIATEPLSGTPGETLLCEHRSYTETRRMMRWFRKSGDRLLYGGRGAFGKSDTTSAFDALHKAMLRQFPMLEGIAITHRWSGLVAMTIDSLPHLSRLDDRVVACVGFNGTGVALASGIGPHVAAMVRGESPDLGLITSTPLQRIPFYGLREPAVRLVAGWYQFLDAMGR